MEEVSCFHQGKQIKMFTLFLFHICLNKLILITPKESCPHCVRGRLRPPGAWHRVVRKWIRYGSLCFRKTLATKSSRATMPCVFVCRPHAGWPGRGQGRTGCVLDAGGNAEMRGKTCFSQPAFCSLCILKGRKSLIFFFFLSLTTLFGICQRNLWWLRQ